MSQNYHFQQFSDPKQILSLILFSIINSLSKKQMAKSESQTSKNHLEDFTGEVRSLGSWSFNQNLLYVIFLQKNKLVMVSKKKRRNLRIFDRISEFISTRNSLQCRSHHQKLLQKFGQVKKIVSNFKKYVSKEDFRNKFQEMFGKDKNKVQCQPKCLYIKEEVLSQEIQETPIETQKSIPIIVEPRISQLQFIYNDYLAELSRQMYAFPILNYYYTGVQNYV